MKNDFRTRRRLGIMMAHLLVWSILPPITGLISAPRSDDSVLKRGVRMDIGEFNSRVLTPALGFLPHNMDTSAARAMLIAIALQESTLVHRTQLVGSNRQWWQAVAGGPARGFWQFERIGVQGVLEHSRVGGLARGVVKDFSYPPDHRVVHKALAHNDLLAAALARILLWTVPERLPYRGESDRAWRQYLRAWRPGKPRSGPWEGNYRKAWSIF